jgi:hypothetical protein
MATKMSANWTDQRVHQLYITAKDSYNKEDRKEAIRSLGRLARNGNDDAAGALGDISRISYNEDDRKLASQELGKD